MVLTPRQRAAIADVHTKNSTTPTQEKDLKVEGENDGKSSPILTTIPQILKRADFDSIFDIVEFCKASRIQISPAEYLRMNPGELNKLIEHVHHSSPIISAK